MAQPTLAAPPSTNSPTAEQVNIMLSNMTIDSALFCPSTGQFMTQPILDGNVDSKWLQAARSHPIFKSHLPQIGTPLIRSRFGTESFPVSHLCQIKMVHGENGLAEHLRLQVLKRDGLLSLNQQKMLEAGRKLKELAEQLEELKARHQMYDTTIQSMALGMKAIEEQRNETVEQVEKKLAKQEEELKVVRDSGKVLGEQVESWRKHVDEVNALNRELETKVQSLLEALSVPRVPEESSVIIERLESQIRRLSAAPTSPILMEENKENVPRIIPVVERSQEVNKLLELHGLRATFRKDFNTNGLSLFQAVSQQISAKYECQKNASELLAELLNYFHEPNIRSLFQEQVKSTQNNEEPNWQLFLEFIRRGGVSDCIIDALSKCLRVHIKVFTSSGINDYKGSEWFSRDEPIEIAFFGGHAPFYLSTEKLEVIQID